MTRKARAVLVGLVVAGIVGVAAPAASAADGDGLCDLGYSCIYKDRQYAGGVLGSGQMSKSLWGNLGWNDKASSVSANGRSCKYTNYYENARSSDGAPYGDYFQMSSRSLVGENHRDPDLTNGAGIGSNGKRVTADWNDRISGFTFTGC